MEARFASHMPSYCTEGTKAPKAALHPSKPTAPHPITLKLDTLRENCGIIRKQASTDGGVLWKVVCVDVVQVR
ncbi:hypothetical protein TNCV_1390381 [Trichonephila clavipes]|nr:hypothetical protein TNCV_1390381 [Trichonephila clavipes]